MNLSHNSFLHPSDSYNDEIYRLHLARAISRPCYLMACYVSVSEKNTEPPLKLGGAEFTRGSPSLSQTALSLRIGPPWKRWRR